MAKGKVHAKAAEWVSGATASAMFFGVTKAQPALAQLHLPGTIAATLAAGFGGFVLYRLLRMAFMWAFTRSSWIREKILGSHYIEGTWIGHYYRNGRLMFSIEVIDQRHEDIRISGRQIDEKGDLHAQWRSTSAALDGDGTQLSYSYTCTILPSSLNHIGIGVFQVHSPEHGQPTELIGFAVDTTNGKADPNHEYKIGGRLMCSDEILRLATARFGP